MILVFTLRVGRSFAWVLVVFVAVVIPLSCVTAQTVAPPKVTIELSPATINAGSKTTLAVTVSDPGNSSLSYSQLNITTIIPPHWECESDVGADCSIHSVLNLMKGQSNLTEYRILIPPNASQGDYFIHVRVSWNQTYSAIYSGRVSVTAQTVAPRVTIELSPATINAGSKTTLAVTVSDPGNSSLSYSTLNITTLVPSHWKNYSTTEPAHSLTKGQSTLAEYRISIPANASQGDYSIHLVVSWNQTYSAVYSGRVSVQYVFGPSLPGDIPFVLAVIILPGFIAIAIGVYLGGSKVNLFSLSSTLQLLLVSILLGAFIWQTGKLGFILATPNVNVLLSTLSDTAFFQSAPFNWLKFWTILNLQNIWVRTALVAIAIAFAARIGAGVNWVLEKLVGTVGSRLSGGVGRAWGIWVRGYEQMRITAWEAQMRSSRQNRRGYRTKVTLSLGQQQQTKTPDPNKPPDPNKTLQGLFVAGDTKDPLNLILDPQYVVEDADRTLLASSAPFWLRSRITRSNDNELNDLLRGNGAIIENALQRAMDTNKKITNRFLTGRTLIREPVLRWEMSPEREPMAKFQIDGEEIPTPEMKSPKITVPLQALRADVARMDAYDQKSINQMKDNLKQEGQTAPIEIDKGYHIINGNLRYLAARELGISSLTAVMKEPTRSKRRRLPRIVQSMIAGLRKLIEPKR